MAASIATLKDVAAAAGVAVSTASRALAGNPIVAVETRERVQKCAEALNYRPNAQARALRSSRSNIIGVTIPSLINPYFAEMASAIQQEASRRGLSTIISSTSEDPDQLTDSLHVLADQRVDGILVVPYNGTEAVLRELDSSGMPLMLMDRELPDSGLTSVASDPSMGFTAAVDHLVSRGHRRIGYLSGPLTTSTGQSRLEAFTAAVRARGLGEMPVYHGGFHRSNGLEGARALLNQDVDAVIAGDSMMSIGALEACHVAGIVIGRDLAFIGYDDQPVMALQSCPITVIDQGVADMGRMALRLLLDMASGKSPPATHRLPTSLIIRPSTNFHHNPAQRR